MPLASKSSASSYSGWAPWSPAAKKAKRTPHDGWLRSSPRSPRIGGAPAAGTRRTADHRVDLEGAVEAGAVEHLVGDRFVAVPGVPDDQREMGGGKQRAGRQLEAARLGQGEGGPALAARALEIGLAAQFLLDLVVLDVAHAEAQSQAVLGLVAGEARIGVEFLAVVAQEFELDALLDLPAVARIDGLQHHAAADLGDAAAGT